MSTPNTNGSETIADAAKLAGLDAHVPAAAAAIDEGLREFDRADRERAARTDNDRFAEKIRREMEENT
jgi:hypothetical protein